ncbi:ubiquitin-conjugating enzyme E2 [Kordia antarctica]|nr:ubiquitin-conjugating enzyme E2 [Kordia antarctica]
MVNIKGDIISWEAIKGIPPYVEEYRVTLNIKGIIGEGPKYREVHTVNVKIPSNYPKAAPDVRMETTPFVYHPNWYEDGKWCFGTWMMSEGLGHHVVRMARTLQYDLDITNEDSPANEDANTWFMANKKRNIFPCDNKLLPDPTKEKMSISMRPKKKFDIN